MTDLIAMGRGADELSALVGMPLAMVAIAHADNTKNDKCQAMAERRIIRSRLDA